MFFPKWVSIKLYRDYHCLKVITDFSTVDSLFADARIPKKGLQVRLKIGYLRQRVFFVFCDLNRLRFRTIIIIFYDFN